MLQNLQEQLKIRKIYRSRDTGGLYDIDQAIELAEWWKINDWGK